MKKKLLIFPFAFLLILLLTFFYLLMIERNPNEIPSTLINKKFPDFESVTLFKNKKFILSKNLKSEVVMINFFATWCKPCRDEHVYMQKFSNEERIRIIGINYKDNPEKTVQWLKNLGNPYSDILLDRKGKIAIDWGVYGIPETFIIDKEGIVKYRQAGPVTEKIYKKINLLIKEIE